MQITDKDAVSPRGVLDAMEWLGEVLIQDSAHRVVLDPDTLDPVCVLLRQHPMFLALATRHKQRLRDKVGCTHCVFGWMLRAGMAGWECRAGWVATRSGSMPTSHHTSFSLHRMLPAQWYESKRPATVMDMVMAGRAEMSALHAAFQQHLQPRFEWAAPTWLEQPQQQQQPHAASGDPTVCTIPEHQHAPGGLLLAASSSGHVQPGGGGLPSMHHQAGWGPHPAQQQQPWLEGGPMAAGSSALGGLPPHLPGGGGLPSMHHQAGWGPHPAQQQQPWLEGGPMAAGSSALGGLPPHLPGGGGLPPLHHQAGWGPQPPWLEGGPTSWGSQALGAFPPVSLGPLGPANQAGTQIDQPGCPVSPVRACAPEVSQRGRPRKKSEKAAAAAAAAAMEGGPALSRTPAQRVAAFADAIKTSAARQEAGPGPTRPAPPTVADCRPFATAAPMPRFMPLHSRSAVGAALGTASAGPSHPSQAALPTHAAASEIVSPVKQQHVRAGDALARAAGRLDLTSGTQAPPGGKTRQPFGTNAELGTMDRVGMLAGADWQTDWKHGSSTTSAAKPGKCSHRPHAPKCQCHV